MFSSLVKTWQVNHGTPIAICSLIVALVMSIAWRFDLIPDIRPPSNFVPGYGSRQTTPATLLIVTITSDVIQEGDCIFQLVDESMTPVFSQTCTLKDGQAEFVVTSLRRGTYAGLAFIDSNQDGEFNVENGVAKEPFGWIRPKRNQPTQAMADSVFELSQEPTFVKVHISQSSR
jgi:uncharacterized protein (DUF2141 family)